MAKLIQCDRCGKQIKTNNINKETTEISIPILDRFSRAYDLDSLSNKNYDICKDCLIELNDFLKPIPKEK